MNPHLCPTLEKACTDEGQAVTQALVMGVVSLMLSMATVGSAVEHASFSQILLYAYAVSHLSSLSLKAASGRDALPQSITSATHVRW